MKPEDFTDVGQATNLVGEYAGRICYSPATAWMAYENGMREENEPKFQHVVKELTTSSSTRSATERTGKPPTATTRNKSHPDPSSIEFTPYLWHTLVDHAEVSVDSTIAFTFRDGRSQAIPLKK
ncbi:hypothetical protein [Corynebacterium pelargi]|uniref:Uncharacterized protein n=1 Tax=Corynebacterium pelargi TaxID=1471400 RepID=A0A410W6U8_9CORY|nr:hypothetical protein [Corynebacterium pelargi]QAU51692.1 hypothetical protein CPELA_01970 [Corynebacterium pelargi]GGG80543.1 hypothetical protein GCM10007338_18860 [Corynebacterium pelargi]